MTRSIMNHIQNSVATAYNKMHWFSDEHAWVLFRLFAFVEAVGWTLLISAITYRHFDMPLSDIAVSIAGTLHGLFFSLYFIFAIITARSMMWGFWRVVAALLAGMPPYTALIFERVTAYHRKKYPTYIAPPPGYSD